MSLIVIAKEINVPQDCETIEQAIQKANSGDVILLSEGNYHETLRIDKDNITLRGSEPEKVKIISESNDKSILAVEGVQSLRISGITFQYSQNQEEAKEDVIAAINIKDSIDIKLEKCCIPDGKHIGVQFINSTGEVSGAIITNSKKAGLLVSGQEAVLEIKECLMTKNQDYSVVVVKGAKCSLSNNTCKDNGGGYLCQGPDSEIDITQDTFDNNINALLFTRGSKANVKQCKITNSSERVIFSQDEGTQLIADQCELVNNKRVAITVTSGSHGKINACRINQNATGISISNKSSAEVTNCTLFDNKNVGIYIKEHSEGTNIRQNTIKNMATFGIILSNSSRADISDNTIESVKTGISVCSSCTASISRNCLINNHEGIRCLRKCIVSTDSNVFEGNKEYSFIQLNEYVLKGKYDLLESIANEFRNNKSEVNGASDGFYFYYKMNNHYDFKNPERVEALAKSYDKWIEVKPDSMTALIAKAAMHVAYAWNARGTGFSDTVSEQGLEIFKTELEKAGELLQKAATSSNNDIGLYREWLSVAMGLSKSKDQTYTIFQKALAIDPDCMEVYFSMTRYLLPRWHGEHGDVQAFAIQARQYPNKLNGDTIYALIAGNMLKSTKKEDYYRMGFSYDRIVAGYKKYHEIYPNDKKSFSRLAYLAYQEKDAKTVAEAFDVIGDYYDNTFWKSRSAIEKYRKMAQDYKNKQKNIQNKGG